MYIYSIPSFLLYIIICGYIIIMDTFYYTLYYAYTYYSYIICMYSKMYSM